MNEAGIILIVDDNIASLETLADTLLDQGYEIHTANNGFDALAEVQKRLPDVVLLDVSMPGMDGFEVCRRLRAEPETADVAVVMVTAMDDRKSWLHAIQLGVDDFISKPIDRLQLRARVEALSRMTRQRRLRKKELVAERDQTRAILDAIGEALVVTDAEGRIVVLNPAVSTLTGYSNEELLGAAFLEHPVGRPLAQLSRTDAAETDTGGTWRGEFVGQRKDGTSYDGAVTVAPMAGGSVIAIRDISQIKSAERAKEQFLANMTHELRTPLGVMSLIGGNLEKLYGSLSDSVRRQMISDLRRNVRQLNEFVTNVLEITALEKSAGTGPKETVDLTGVVEDVCSSLRPSASAKSINLQLLTGEPVHVLAAARPMRLIVRNLLANAITYTPERGRIICECRQLSNDDQAAADWPNLGQLPAGNWAGIRLTDTGIGISQEDLPHIFERFYRVQSQSSIRGSGLGLSLVQQLAQLHGGHVSVCSDYGEGSTFAVYLPIKEEI